MKNSMLDFTREKSRKKYRIIGVFVFISVIVINIILQTLSLSVQTLHNEVLNSKNLSLILMQDYNKKSLPYPVDLSRLNNIEHIKFVTKSKSLGLNGATKNGPDQGFITYAINPTYSYYLGITHMQENTLYCSSTKYKHLEQYKIRDLNTHLTLRSYDAPIPMIFSDSCFISENTYKTIIKDLPEGATKFVVPEYIIGVDNVKNVFTVVQHINALYTDDDPLLLYQANGLEGIVNDSSNLLFILAIVFIIFIIFNTMIIFFLSSSLVSELSRDLMVLYLNGMSRKKISKELNRYTRSYFGSAMFFASAISIVFFIIVMMYVLKQPINIYWIILLLVIDVGSIGINIFTIKFLINRMVKSKTSNNNISKIVRN